jgi:hypothetical protein
VRGTAAGARRRRQVRLGEFGFRPGERFTYEYNFFAGWRRDILADLLDADADGDVPVATTAMKWPGCRTGHLHPGGRREL